MRRMINNSTAIVACLSLLAPNFAWAQSEEGAKAPVPLEELLPAETAEKQAELERQAEELLKEELNAEEAEQPAETQPAEEQPAEEQPAEPEAAQDEAPDNQAEEQPAEDAAAQEPTEEPEAAQDETKAGEAEAQPEQDAPKQKPAEKPDAAKEEAKAGEAEAQPKQDAPKKKSAEKPDAAKEEAKASEAEAQPKQDGQITLSDSKASATRQTEMKGLTSVLQEEISAGLDESQLTCLSGAAYPCADGGPVVTPRGVVLESQEDGAFILASGDQQMKRVDENGDLVPRVAEEGAKQTAIAKEVAGGTAIGDLAALLDDGKGEVVEQKVTEENSRSSSEDFTTNLRDALEGKKAASETRSNDDDSSDLGKALLLGLGAVAVGSMLNNNRQVALSSPDRVVVTRPDGSQEIIKDETAMFRQPGSTVATENFDDGSSRTIVTREDGSKIVTIRDADLRVLRRTLIAADGSSTQLIDDTAETAPVDIADLPSPVAPSPYDDGPMSEVELREALQREAEIDRRFSLAQVRNIPEVRSLVAPVNIEGITFETGSAAIRPAQADKLATFGNVIQKAIQENPNEIFLIEGHTDTVGASAMNLALSDRRAESVALALSEYYDVPTENLVVQGYGEQYLRVRSEGDIRANRRASVRRITDLLQGAE